MSTIDRIMIIATFAAAVWWAVARRRRSEALVAVSGGALVMAVGTLALEGVVWQLVPWQLLAAAVSGAAALRHWRPGRSRRWRRVIGRCALVVGLALGGITLLTAFVPTMPKPSGPYSVGTSVSVSIAILTGAREEEAGMISGLNTTGHEIGGTIGIAIFSTIAAGTGVLAGPQAATGISHAFIAAAILAGLASLVALAILPGARHFVAKLRLNPATMPIH